MKKLGLYVHIPFCVRKCKYCGFVSFDNCSCSDWDAYVEALLREIDLRSEEYKDYEVDTIFIGGGTPSIIPAERIADILEKIKNRFNNAIKQEISIEANPGTLTSEKLKIYRNAGINRLSIGVQSLDDDVLKAIGRIHDRKTVFDTFDAARKAGFDNINMDLMFSLPKQTDEIWESTVREAIELKPEHISFYSLQIEEGTEFYEMYKRGELDIADDDSDRQRYHKAAQLLKEVGYVHYEISNAALPGYESKHNSKYWTLDEYLGLGIAAHSFARDKRFYNTSELSVYLEALTNGGTLDQFKKLAVTEDEVCTRDDLIFEFVFTGLRMTKGISLDDFEKRFGIAFFDYYADKHDYIQEQIREGFMIYDEAEQRLALTLSGIDVSNAIMSEFAYNIL